MSISPKVQKIIEWRDCLCKMQGDRFFEIIQMYLGEVKTPYNKQNLLEELGLFLGKEENQSNFVKLLCNIDLKILAAIHYIPNVTPRKIESCFGNLFTKLSLVEHIANLIQRLLIFEYENEITGQVELRINPFLEDCILPLIPIDILLASPSVKINRKTEAILLTPQLLASFISYVIMHSDLCKADGGIKKKNSGELSQIFGCNISFDVLIKAFCNLNLFHQEEKTVSVDWERLGAFSALPEIYQYAYLCSASCGHFSRNTLHANAQLLYDTLVSIPYEGFERQSILNLSVLIKENTSNELVGQTGRFAQLMAKASGSSMDMTAELVMDGMIDSCISLGLLYKGAVDGKGNEIYYSPSAFTARNIGAIDKKNLLSIDAGSVVTILPGLSLAEFLPLIKFLSVSHYDTAVEFEINRQSVMRAFDLGMTTSLIQEELSKYSSYSIPQNVIVSIEDWSNSYASASLYHGYVLRVSKDNIAKTKNNRFLSPYIIEEIADGIFLLNFQSDSEAQSVIARSGLDFVGRIHSAKVKGEVLSFMRLRRTGWSISECEETTGPAKFKLVSSLEQNKIVEDLKSLVLKMDIPLEQKEGLLDRVERRIIVNESQLVGNTVRFERLEASGMDYQGKIHIINEAIQAKSLLEIRLEDYPAVVGLPVSLIKHESDADLEMALEDNSTRIIQVGKVSCLKKIRKNLTFI